MTNIDTQTLVALVCVAVALAVLCRRTLLWWRGQSTGCGGGCHGCGETKPTQLKVPLMVLTDAEVPRRREMENEK
ncbi:MAG: hypothetical protein ACKV2Q_18835 [Planctomycetaceae bacterium]